METTWLSLRTGRGIPVGPRGGPVEVLARAWLARDLATSEKGSLVLTPRGWLLLDELSLEMVEAMEGEVVRGS